MQRIEGNAPLQPPTNRATLDEPTGRRVAAALTTLNRITNVPAMGGDTGRTSEAGQSGRRLLFEHVIRNVLRTASPVQLAQVAALISEPQRDAVLVRCSALYHLAPANAAPDQQGANNSVPRSN